MLDNCLFFGVGFEDIISKLEEQIKYLKSELETLKESKEALEKLKHPEESKKELERELNATRKFFDLRISSCFDSIARDMFTKFNLIKNISLN